MSASWLLGHLFIRQQLKMERWLNSDDQINSELCDADVFYFDNFHEMINKSNILMYINRYPTSMMLLSAIIYFLCIFFIHFMPFNISIEVINTIDYAQRNNTCQARQKNESCFLKHFLRIVCFFLLFLILLVLLFNGFFKAPSGPDEKKTKKRFWIYIMWHKKKRGSARNWNKKRT